MDKDKKNIFNWGDTVKVKSIAPKHLKPGHVGSICGMRQILSEKGVAKHICQKGEWVYTVEYIGGLDNEIAEHYLDRYPDCLKYITNEKVIMKPNNPEGYHNSERAYIIDFHLIADGCLAKKFNLQIGDPVYILKSESGEKFLAPESYIDRRISS